MAKPTRKTKLTLRRTMPKSKTPLARELAELGNALQSAKLLVLSDKVAERELTAAALEAAAAAMYEQAQPQQEAS